MWKFDIKVLAFKGALFHIRKLLITCSNGSSGVYNPKWWIIQKPFIFDFEMHFWACIWIEMWDLRTQRALSFLSFLYTSVFTEREKKKIYVWVLRPSSTGQVKLELEETEMVATFTKIAKQDIPKRNQNKIYLKWYRIWLNIAELYVVMSEPCFHLQWVIEVVCEAHHFRLMRERMTS